MLTTLTLTAALLFPTLSKDLVAPVPGVSSRVSATRLAQMAARVDRLEAKAQLELYLGRHRPGDYIAGRVQLDSRALRLRKLRRDPALADFARIEARWLAEASGGTELFGSARELVQAKVMVTRNLHFRELEPTAANVAREVERILDQRGRFASLSLFEGRDVVYAASADRTRDAKKRKIFGRTVTQRQIERSGGRLHFLQAAGGREKPSLRRDLGREVASATQPLTFVFEGHGRPEAVKFAGSLRATEIAELIPSARRSSRPSSSRRPATLTPSSARCWITWSAEPPRLRDRSSSSRWSTGSSWSARSTAIPS